MKKQWILVLAMLLCLCMLTACQSDEETTRYDVLTDSNLGSVTADEKKPAQQPEGDEYDPRVEEDNYVWEVYTPVPQVETRTPAPTVRSEYAGATPVLIDPIDKPTPSPVPPLNITYKTYDATKLGLSFEGPAGWRVDDSAANSYTIQNPDMAIPDYAATLTIRAEKVDAQYTKKQLEDVVEGMLDAIDQDPSLKSFDGTDTASRALLGKDGVYANYDGVLSTTGRKIAGRVQAGCVDKVLYTIHITFPVEYEDEYIDKVFHHLRDTIKITK